MDLADVVMVIHLWVHEMKYSEHKSACQVCLKAGIT